MRAVRGALQWGGSLSGVFALSCCAGWDIRLVLIDASMYLVRAVCRKRFCVLYHVMFGSMVTARDICLRSLRICFLFCHGLGVLFQRVFVGIRGCSCALAGFVGL